MPLQTPYSNLLSQKGSHALSACWIKRLFWGFPILSRKFLQLSKIILSIRGRWQSWRFVTFTRTQSIQFPHFAIISERAGVISISEKEYASGSFVPHYQPRTNFQLLLTSKITSVQPHEPRGNIRITWFDTMSSSL